MNVRVVIPVATVAKGVDDEEKFPYTMIHVPRYQLSQPKADPPLAEIINH